MEKDKRDASEGESKCALRSEAIHLPQFAIFKIKAREKYIIKNNINQNPRKYRRRKTNPPQ
jgi:hypothetical protein